MAKERADKLQNMGLVAAEVIENPQQSLQEIADKTGIAKSSVSRAMSNLEQNGTIDPTINIILDSAKDRLIKIGEVLDKYVDQVSKKRKIPTYDAQMLVQIAKDDTARGIILGGGNGQEKLAKLEAIRIIEG